MSMVEPGPWPAQEERRPEHHVKARSTGAECITGEYCLVRRIWEIDPEALLTVLGLLLRRADLEDLFHRLEQQDISGTRADALLHQAVARCSRPCLFAEQVEQLLDRRSRMLRHKLLRRPMFELAKWCSSTRDDAAGEELATLYWSLVSDRRWVVQSLAERVRGDIWVRALRLLGRYQNQGSTEAVEGLSCRPVEPGGVCGQVPT